MQFSFNQQNIPEPVKSKIRLCLLLGCIFLNYLIYGQKSSLPSLCNWSDVTLDKQYVPAKGDSCLFVVSTRHYDETKKEFVDYDYDTTATLKYFTLYYRGNSWTAVPYPSLEAMLDTKDSFRDLVVFTEGLGKTFTLGVDRATKLMRLYAVDELFFDWPTERPYMKPGKNIKITYQIAPDVAVPYARFLEEFQAYKISHSQKFQTVTLFFHSMGNLLLMYDLQKGLYKHISPGLVDNVVLNAACVNQHKHKAWLNNLSFAKNIYVTVNDRDRNLRGASIIFAAYQLGLKPKPKYCDNVKYVDFSAVLDDEHNYFLIAPLLQKKPYLKEFYKDVFVGKNPQLQFPDPAISEEVRKYLPGKDAIGIFTGM